MVQFIDMKPEFFINVNGHSKNNIEEYSCALRKTVPVPQSREMIECKTIYQRGGRQRNVYKEYAEASASMVVAYNKVGKGMETG